MGQRLILIWITEWLCLAVAGLLCDGPLPIKGGDCGRFLIRNFMRICIG